MRREKEEEKDLILDMWLRCIDDQRPVQRWIFFLCAALIYVCLFLIFSELLFKVLTSSKLNTLFGVYTLFRFLFQVG